jgi:ABC-type uncharacterized transport system involved in gliding motility auxiliary subunit
METALKFSGYFGIVLLAFGTLGALIAQNVSDQPLLVAHIILGFLSLIAWAVTSGLDGVSRAGSVLAGRSARYGANAMLYSVAVAVIVCVLNFAVNRSDKRWDLTEAGVFSLSEKSINAVKGLKGKLKLVAFDVPQAQDRTKTEDLLKLYAYHNKTEVFWDIINPAAKPLEVDRMQMKPGNMLYLEYGEGDKRGVSRINTIDEQTVTNAILKLTRGTAKKMYYVQGHGEPALDGDGQGGIKELADALADEHLVLEGILLAQTGKVPEDASAVFLVNPKGALSQVEKDALIVYGEKGGRLLLFSDAENQSNRDVAEIAAKFGITVGQDVIIDQQLRLFAGPQLAVEFYAQQFGTHPITTRLSRTEPPVFSFSSSVAGGKGDAKSTYSELVKSGPASWGEKNLQLIFGSEEAAASKDPDDVAGPVTLAVALERKLDSSNQKGADGGDVVFDKATRVVAFGDSSWILNGTVQAIGNRDLALSTISWVAGEEGGVTIGPKALRASILPLQESQYKMILALSFLAPEIILLVGLFIWWNRRRLATT